MLFERYFSSPIGPLHLVATEEALVALHLPGHGGSHKERLALARNHSVLDQAELELTEYFAGTRTIFETKTSARGTPFQEKVWAALRTIPYGAVCSYAELAQRVSGSRFARAVGNANGRNPLSILVPCHRVIASDGTLGGYGGGVPAKAWLLEHEARFG